VNEWTQPGFRVHPNIPGDLLAPQQHLRTFGHEGKQLLLQQTMKQLYLPKVDPCSRNIPTSDSDLFEHHRIIVNNVSNFTGRRTVFPNFFFVSLQ